MARVARAQGRRRDDARPEAPREAPPATPGEARRDAPGARRRRPLRRLLLRGGLGLIGLAVLLVAALGAVNPPTTPYMWSEGRRLGHVEQEWVRLDEVSPDLARAVVAAEDAGFCAHWGIDVGAVRAALAEGSGRGASTITQQVAKNVFLWQGRSWARKALEAALAPLLELLLPKARVLELYLNLAEWGEGTFGAEAAARRYFGVGAADLSAGQAAALAVLLPAPKLRDPRALPPALARHAARVADGAATIARDGRAACLEAR